MDITEKKVFRKSFLGGFSKEDVNKYIEESTAKYTEQIKELEEKFSASDNERTELAKKLADAELKIAELQMKSDELDALQQKHNALVTDHESTCARLADATDSLAAVSARAEALARVDAEYTARKTELADIEISARARAAAVISDSERDAAAKKAALEEELNLARSEFEEKRAAALGETDAVVAGISNVLSSLKTEIESMDSRISRIADTVRGNIGMLSDSVEDADTKLADIRLRLCGSESEE